MTSRPILMNDCWDGMEIKGGWWTDSRTDGWRETVDYGDDDLIFVGRISMPHSNFTFDGNGRPYFNGKPKPLESRRTRRGS
mmetsp:Transcript_20202/g.60051  ORF Transcript_20202/g.60051 Transcript_20202/m.60051 type:complete len:81 (+) Transcript_20202:87-329(+)